MARNVKMVVVLLSLVIVSWSIRFEAAGALQSRATASLRMPQLDRTQTSSKVDAYRMVVGPEILVSRDPFHPHTEMLIAANPTDANNLVAAAIVNRANGYESQVAASHDGGNSWTWFVPVAQQEAGSVDELVAFGSTGTAYFLAHAKAAHQSQAGKTSRKGASPSMPAGYSLYRSEDGGRIWELTQSGIKLGDHPWAAVDLSNGPHRGNLYVAWMGGKLRRSTDDGRSLSNDVINAPAVHNSNGSLIVLSDGTVLSTEVRFDFNRQTSPSGEGAPAYAITVTSSDGGRTWSEAIRAEIPYSPRGRPSIGGRAAAGDGWLDSPFKDRIYLAWREIEENRSRILVSSSSDRGRTWSKPVSVTPDRASFQLSPTPTLAVNKDGVLAVMYYDAGNDRDGGFNAYITASIDGGASFLSAHRLTSKPSRTGTSAHHRPVLRYLSSGNACCGGMGPNTVTISLWSTFEKFPTGGDYLGLTADVDGIFHPLWADSRSGTYQVYTSRVAVMKDSKLSSLRNGLSETMPLDLRLRVRMDPFVFDSSSGTAVLPIRLHNVSPDTVFAPVTVQIKRSVLSAMTWNSLNRPDGTRWDGRSWHGSEIVNAHNRIRGAGASFDYTSALGEFGFLPPGGVSSAVEWRVTVPKPDYDTFDFEVEMFGRLRSRVSNPESHGK